LPPWEKRNSGMLEFWSRTPIIPVFHHASLFY
jgi:hypothetical protein